MRNQFQYNIIIILIAIHSLAIAQQNENLKDYIPTEEISIKLMPPIEIKVHLHIIQYSKEKPKNLTLDSIHLIDQQFNWINDMYQHLNQPTLTSSDDKVHYIPDSRIRFRIDTILFHKDHLDWDRIHMSVSMTGAAPFKIDSISITDQCFYIRGKQWANTFINSDSIAVFDSRENNGTYKLSDIRQNSKHTILKVKDEIRTTDLSGKLSYFKKVDNNCNKDLWKKYTKSNKEALHVFMTGSSLSKKSFGCGPSPYYLNVSVVGNYSYAIAQLIAHELGHTIGLRHTNIPQFPDLPQKDKFGFIPCNETNTSNNIMGYNMCRKYLSPLQIAYVHKRYSADSSLIRLTTANEYDTSKTIQIWYDTTWNTSKIIKGDLVVRKGTTLSINNQVHLSSKSIIYLEKKSSLIVEGGTLTNFFESGWGGIQTCRSYERKNKKARKIKNQGKIILKNGGRVINNKITQ